MFFNKSSIEIKSRRERVIIIILLFLWFVNLMLNLVERLSDASSLSVSLPFTPRMFLYRSLSTVKSTPLSFVVRLPVGAFSGVHSPLLSGRRVSLMLLKLR